MSLNSINKCLTNNTLWIISSIIIMILYLSPLFYDIFYVPTFDNLDSNVVWFKILAESGMIFANNDAIIPNMMNGLPRSSYGSEFNVILWLYYFFEPKTAFIINEVTIHLVAFFSMYIFLNKYIVKQNTYYGNVPIFVGALYFALLPFWSGAGLSIAILPLVTYSLLNIKNNISTKWDWLLIIVLPLYTSFIFLYMFYIIMAGIYLMWDTIKNHKLNKPFFFALFLMGTVFLLSEYRLVLITFTDSGFISHRTEFNIFLNNNTLDAFRKGHSFFLNGHIQHLIDLQMPYLLPVIIIAMILSLSLKKFNKNESIIIWILIVISYSLNLWSSILSQLFSLPVLTIYTFFIFLFTKKTRIIPLLFLLQLLLALLTFLMDCSCGKEFIEFFPILSTLNIARLAFIQPFIWSILLVLSLYIYLSRLHYTFWFILLFMSIQTIHEFNAKEFSHNIKPEYASFENYYTPNLFKKIKIFINTPLEDIRVASFGLEPAITLYNGFYTVDGYSTNYPLEYKRKFHKVVEKYLNKIDKDNNYNEWGSKVYLLGIISTPTYYQKGVTIQYLPFNIKPLCELNTDYIISAYKINIIKNSDLELKNSFVEPKDSWDIYLYKIICNK